MQTTLLDDEGAATCTCDVYAATGALGGPALCHHTAFVLQHKQQLLLLPEHEPGEPVPVGSKLQLQVGGKLVFNCSKTLQL